MPEMEEGSSVGCCSETLKCALPRFTIMDLQDLSLFHALTTAGPSPNRDAFSPQAFPSTHLKYTQTALYIGLKPNNCYKNILGQIHPHSQTLRAKKKKNTAILELSPAMWEAWV